MTTVTTPDMAARMARAADITPAKRVKALQETANAAESLTSAMATATRLAETLGATHPETLDAYKQISELGLTIGRRTRILAGLPRGG